MSNTTRRKRRRVGTPETRDYIRTGNGGSTSDSERNNGSAFDTLDDSISQSNSERYACTIDFQIDIICSEATERGFIEKFGTVGTDEFYDLIRTVVANRRYELPESPTSSSPPIYSDEQYESNRSPKPGDRVSVSYTPASQKYIDYYNSQAFTGEVFYVDEETDNFFMWKSEVGKISNNVVNITYRVQSYKREGSHYFGMSDCYDGYYSFV